MSDYRESYTIKFKREIMYPDGTTRLLDAPFIICEMVTEEDINKSNCPDIRAIIVSRLVDKLMEKIMEQYA